MTCMGEGMRTIGLLGGMSWESSALYYRVVNEAVRERLGGYHSARVLMSSVDFADVERLQAAGEWDAAGELLAAEARALEAAGAECLVLCTNTMHKVAGAIEAATTVPLLHIADVTAAAVRESGATGVALLGHPPLVQPFLRYLADTDADRAAADTRDLWLQMEGAFAFLHGHLTPLLGWLTDEQPSRENLTAFTRCAGVLAGIDLHQVATQPAVAGELLGPIYSHLRSVGSRQATGAFFTPMTVCTAMANCLELTEGDSFAEPSCGAGAMAVAAARDLRRRGLDPAQVRWVLNDIDPLAVALAGVNAVVHRLGPHVTLRSGDGLTLGSTSHQPGHSPRSHRTAS